MALEIATILLGLAVAAVAVLYAAPRGYMGHRRIKTTAAPTSITPYAPAPEPVKTTPAPAPAPVETVTPAPTPAPAIYETVQPAPAPVTYAPPSSTSFGAPTITRKPIRTYRRRTAPVRSASASKTAKTKPKKR